MDSDHTRNRDGDAAPAAGASLTRSRGLARGYAQLELEYPSHDAAICLEKNAKYANSACHENNR
jgi:hypothetical protein